MTWFSAKRIWQLITAALAVGGAIATLYAPIIAVVEPMGAAQADGRATALDVLGASAYVAVAIPLACAIVPLFFSGAWWGRLSTIGAGGLILFSVLGIASFGLLFVPATLTGVLTAFLQTPPEP